MLQKDNGHNITTNIKCYLNGNKNYSVYEEDFELKGNKNTQNSENLEGNEIISFNTNPVFFKDLSNNVIYYSDHVRFNFFNIVDRFEKIEWTIENETKFILNYDCQKATCKFRGRNFVVYFSKELPFNDGPWKLSGLPGLILEVSSIDKIATFEIKAEKIEIAQEVKMIDNMYKSLEKITFEEYCIIYKKKYEESLYKIIDSNGETRPMKKGFKEYYIE
jgi:GLPGLI family protein